LYLTRIGSRYYFRMRTPKDLLGIFPTPFIKHSLRTSQYKSAVSLARLELSKVERVFALLRSGLLNQEQREKLLSEFQGEEKKAVQTRSNSISQCPLSKVIALYCRDYETAGRWTAKTTFEMTSMFNFFLSVIGDRGIGTINRQDLLDYREKLLKTPSHINKRKEYRDKPLEEILKMDVKHTMSVTSINKYLTCLSSLFQWALRNQMITMNPAEGLALPKHNRAEEEREKYSEVDLKRLSEALEYDHKHPERFWIPLIGLHSGMRLTEICQLYLEDVKEVDGVLCFDVNDEKDKRVKNSASKRIVPVHPFLKSLGFIEYIDSLREEKRLRLFENLTLKRDGYGHDFGKWYGRFNREYITDNPKKVFHSFRHNVADSLKQQGIDDFVIAEILGHTHSSITMGRYGKRYQPQVLLSAIERLDYKLSLFVPDRKERREGEGTARPI